jgi:hypothetical protein
MSQRLNLKVPGFNAEILANHGVLCVASLLVLLTEESGQGVEIIN